MLLERPDTRPGPPRNRPPIREVCDLRVWRSLRTARWSLYPRPESERVVRRTAKSRPSSGQVFWRSQQDVWR